MRTVVEFQWWFSRKIRGTESRENLNLPRILEATEYLSNARAFLKKIVLMKLEIQVRKWFHLKKKRCVFTLWKAAFAENLPA